jgi:hypothetical protein
MAVIYIYSCAVSSRTESVNVSNWNWLLCTQLSFFQWQRSGISLRPLYVVQPYHITVTKSIFHDQVFLAFLRLGELLYFNFQSFMLIIEPQWLHVVRCSRHDFFWKFNDEFLQVSTTEMWASQNVYRILFPDASLRSIRLRHYSLFIKPFPSVSRRKYPGHRRKAHSVM